MEQLQAQFRKLLLHGKSQCWQSLTETRQHAGMTLSERLNLLLQAEQQRHNNRFERLRKDARFRYQAYIEELMFDGVRGVTNH